MRFRVLGPMELLDDGDRLSLSSERQRLILAALLIHRGDLVTFDRLVDVLWRGHPPPSARNTLHSHVSRLRKRLAQQPDPLPLHTRSAGYVLDVDEDELDAALFERLLRRARREADEVPERALTLLDEGLALWRGPAYVDVADEEFARGEARRLGELRLVAEEDRIDACLALRRHAEVLGDIEAMVAEHPLRERPRGQLMLALYRCGRHAEALERYRHFREQLAHEAGLDPSAWLEELERDILQQAPQLDAAPMMEHVRAQDDARQSLEVNDGLSLTTVPRPTSAFIGRKTAVGSVATLVERARVVTLVGPGGVGKTRLAQEVAGRLDESFPDGVCFCPLAPVREAEAVPHAVAAALGITRGGGSIEDSLVASLCSRRALLVLDNCEHVLPAAAVLTSRLVASCAQVSVLATSRERLAVQGEHVWPVPPLHVSPPPGKDVSEVESVRMFCERAAAADPAFRVRPADMATIAAICRRLDGLPLAIELAAARVRGLSPDDLATRLGRPFRVLTGGPRGEGGRHRTLRATVEWSYALLPDKEQRLFDRLSVFAGGFRLAAAEQVCDGDGIDAEEIADLLANLVDKSMVVAERARAGTRYGLLETLREYGAQQLQQRRGTAPIRAAHARYYRVLAEETDEGVRGAAEAAAVAVLDDELDNLRAAFRWAMDAADADLALGLCAALHAFAIGRLRDEIFSWTEAAADLPQASGHPLLPAVYGAAAEGVSNRGQLARSVELGNRGLALAGGAADPARVRPMYALAVAALYEGRLHDSRTLAGEAARIAERAGEAYRELTARIVHILAVIYGGDTATALRLAVQQRRLAEVLGNPTHIGWAHYVHGEALLNENPAQAIVLLEQAADIARSVDNRFAEGVALVSATSLRAREGAPGEALRAFSAVIAQWRRVGDWTHQWTTLRNLVDLLARLGASEPAVVLLGASDSAQFAAPSYGDAARRLAALRQRLRAELGGRFDAAAQRGRTLSDDEAVTFALDAVDGALAPDAAPQRSCGAPSAPVPTPVR